MTQALDPQALGARAVLDLRGQARLLGTLWRNQPTVLVWLRHFACLFCKEQASDLRRHGKTEIEERGGRLAFVGSGTTAQAIDFRDRHVPNCAVFTDPSSYTYRTLGATESVASTVAGMVVHGPRAMAHGHFQTRVHRRPFQQGGVIVAAPGDLLVYLHRSRIAGDHPPLREVLEAVSAAALAPAAPDTSAIAQVLAETPATVLTPAPVATAAVPEWRSSRPWPTCPLAAGGAGGAASSAS